MLGPRVADHGWGLGYMLNQRGVNGPNPRIFGHGGLGGSFGFVDLEHRIGYAYVANHFDATKSNADPRSLALSNEVYSAPGRCRGLNRQLRGANRAAGGPWPDPGGPYPGRGHIQAAHGRGPATPGPNREAHRASRGSRSNPSCCPSLGPRTHRAPLRERAWLRLSVGGDTDTGQPQAGGSRKIVAAKRGMFSRCRATQLTM